MVALGNGGERWSGVLELCGCCEREVARCVESVEEVLASSRKSIYKPDLGPRMLGARRIGLKSLAHALNLGFQNYCIHCNNWISWPRGPRFQLTIVYFLVRGGLMNLMDDSTPRTRMNGVRKSRTVSRLHIQQPTSLERLGGSIEVCWSTVSGRHGKMMPYCQR